MTSLHLKDVFAKLTPFRVLMMSLLLFQLSCTRPDDNNSTLKISIPNKIKATDLKGLNAPRSVTAFEYVNLMHVVINVSGAGISAPIVFNFDAEEQCRGCAVVPPLPEIITLPTLAAGSGRLIQVLGVYSDSTSGSPMGALYYGDNSGALVNFDKPEVSVEIPVSLKASGNLRGGSLIGRYLTDATTGPSGSFEIRYAPPSTPALVIDRGFIANGWFQSFLLDSVPLDLVLAGTNQILFSGVSLSGLGSKISGSSTQMAKIDIPDHFNVIRNSGVPAESVILGFFGPGATQQTVCSPSTFTFTKLMQATDHTQPLLYRQSGGIQIVGGSNCTRDSISATELWHSKLYFDPSLIDGGGSKEASGGFYSIFAISAIGGPVHFNHDTTTHTVAVDFSVLPGATVAADKVTFYYRGDAQNRNYERNHVPDCQQIATGGFGFVKMFDVPLTSGQTSFSGNQTDSNILGFSELLSSGQTPVIVTCVFKQNSVAAAGFSFMPGEGNSAGGGTIDTGGGGGGGSPSSPTGPYAWVYKTFPETFAVGDSCFQINLGLGNATATDTMAAVQVLRNNLAVNSFGSLSDCQTQTNGVAALTLNYQGQLRWVKAGPVSTNDSWTLSPMGSHVFSVMNGLASAIGIELEMPSDLVAGFCYSATARVRDATGQIVTVTSALTYTATAPSGLQIYSDSDCANSLTSPVTLTIPAASSSNNFYLKLVSTLPSNTANNLGISASSGNSVNFETSRYIGEATDTVVSQISLWGAQNIQLGHCSDLTVELKNANHQGIPGSATIELAAENLSGQYFSDSSCQVALSNNNLIFTNELRKTSYFKATALDLTAPNHRLVATLNATQYFHDIMVSGPIGKLSIDSADGHNRVVENTCAEFKITLKDLNNALLNSPTNLAININSSGGALYSTLTDCQNTSSPQTTTQLTANSSQVSIWRQTHTDWFSIDAYLSSNSAYQFDGAWAQFVATDLSDPDISGNRLTLYGSYYSYDDCINGTVALASGQYSTMMAYNNTGLPIDFTPALTNAGTASFYHGHFCNGVSSSQIQVQPGDTLAYFSMRVSSGTSPMDLTLSGSYQTNAFPFNIAAATVTQYSLRDDQSFSLPENSTHSSNYIQGASSCDRFYLQSHNVIGARTSEDFSGTLTLREISGTTLFHAQPDCSDSGVAQIALDVNAGASGSAPIFVQISDANVHSIEFKRNGTVFGALTQLTRQLLPITVAGTGLDSDFGTFTAMQSNGQFLVGGRHWTGTEYDLIISRYQSDGTLDTTFGNSGFSIFSAGSFTDDRLYAITLQTDGKIVLVGTTDAGPSSDLLVARLNGNGILDSSFASSGIFTHDFGTDTWDIATAVAIDGAGKIVVTGNTNYNASEDMFLLRLNTDGTFDTALNGIGYIISDIMTSPYELPSALTIDGNGKILVAGTFYFDYDDFGVVRYNADGTFDTTFNSGIGYRVISFITDSSEQLRSMVLQPDGKILLAGSTNQSDIYGNFLVVRLNTDGSFDTGFNSSGFADFDLDQNNKDDAYSLLRQSDGKIVIAGRSIDNGWSRMAITRLDSNGILDTGFSSNGTLVITDMVNFSNFIGKAIMSIPGSNNLVFVGTREDMENDAKFLILTPMGL
jgi:uncharacterized delta-60 repeat protein